MELLNATKMQAGYTLGVDPDGRERIVVVVKGTFSIPSNEGEEATLAEKQVPLVMADEFTGEPGFSACTYESDFAPSKPCCDVVLNGSAYAPEGEPTTRVTVGLQVGEMNKAFDVVGNRMWKKILLSVVALDPEPFVRMPITYDNAFGGFDKSHENEKKHAAFVANPVGQGFHVNLTKEAIEEKLLPNTEEIGSPVKNPTGKYRPMAFGPIGRSWPPRLGFAGTYDQNWLDNVFPFLPADFDERYFQCAPPDQQIAYPTGGEAVKLLNLTPEGRKFFKLPSINVPVTFYPKRGDEKEMKANLDTLIIEPDLERVMLVWRTSMPLKKNIFEIPQAIVGKMSRAWYRAREMGKTFYPSLIELVAAKKQEREETTEETEVEEEMKEELEYEKT